MKKEVNIRVPFGWPAALGLIFVTMKILGYLKWSWWWATAPFWAPPSIALALLVIGGTLYVVVGTLVDTRRAKKRRKAIARRRGR
jgi:hypothetical protein